jgi:nucleotide-binding universal stress UspA family protein
MFSRILHANDGSEYAFHALTLALAIAKQNDSVLHMVSVEEIDYIPEFVEEVREETGTAARRFHTVLQRARAMAEERHMKLHTHVIAGHPVRSIVMLAADLKVEEPEAIRRSTSGWLGAARIASCTLPRARCSS